MESKQVNAILSDYDGTLCPTTSVRGGSGYDECAFTIRGKGRNKYTIFG
jgi:hypothetical protein